MLISLVYNRPYPFARYVFDQFINELNHPKPLLLFPRFVMIIIRHFLPDLPNQGLLARVGVVDNKIFQTCLKHNPRRADEDAPQETPLFGAILNPNYEAPAHNAAEDVAAPVLAGYVSKKVPKVRKYLLENSPGATFIMNLPQVPPMRVKRPIQTVHNETMANKLAKLDVPTASKPFSSDMARHISTQEVHIDATTKNMACLEAVEKQPETILENKRMYEAKLKMQDEVIARQKEMFEAKIQMQDKVIAEQKASFEARIEMQDDVIAEQKEKLKIQDEVIAKQKAMYETKTQMVEAAKLQHEKLMSLIIKSKIAELKVKLERGNPDDEVIRSTGIDIKSVMDLIPESLRVKLEARFSSMYEGFKSLFLTHVDDNQWAKIESELEKKYKRFLE